MWWLHKVHILSFHSGGREGLFSWFAVNQLLGRQIFPGLEDILIQDSKHERLKGPSAALVEFGGASTQVVAQPPVSVLDRVFGLACVS